MKKIWFKTKLYGWGWRPCTWQGWLIILLSIAIFAFFWAKIMSGKNILVNSLIIAADFLALLGICYKFGEKPRWRWGK